MHHAPETLESRAADAPDDLPGAVVLDSRPLLSVRARLIATAVILVLFLVLLYAVREILAPFIVSLVLTYLLAPPVQTLSRKRVAGRELGRGVAILLVYLVIFMAMTLASYLVIPRLYHEVEHIAREAPKYVTEVRTEKLPTLIKNLEARAGQAGWTIDFQGILESSFFGVLDWGKGEVMKLAANLRHVIGGIFHALTSFIVVFLLTAFLLLDLPRIKEGFAGLVPLHYRGEARGLVQAINQDLSGVVRGQAMICLINGTLTTLALLVLQIKYAVTIGIIAGVCSLIPIFGSIISTVPAVLMGLTQSWLVALEVVGVIVVIHLLEANYLNPRILGHETELHPFIILFAIFAGEKLLGVGGLLLGVPLAAVARTLLVHLVQRYILPPPPLTLAEAPAAELPEAGGRG